MIDFVFIVGYVLWLIVMWTGLGIYWAAMYIAYGVQTLIDWLFPGPSQEERLRSAVQRADEKLAQAHTETRRAMNIAAGQSYRNIIE